MKLVITLIIAIEISHNHDLRVFKPALGEFAKDIEVIKTDEPVVEENRGQQENNLPFHYFEV